MDYSKFIDNFNLNDKFQKYRTVIKKYLIKENKNKHIKKFTKIK